MHALVLFPVLRRKEISRAPEFFPSPSLVVVVPLEPHLMSRVRAPWGWNRNTPR